MIQLTISIIFLLIESQNWAVIISTVFGTTGVIAGIAAAVATWRKSKPEANKIIVESAQVIVGLQTQTIENLRKEISIVTEENKRISQENKALKTENEELKDRLDNMEERLKDLTKRTSNIEQHGTN